VLLAFDTATPAVTVALHDGERVVVSHTQVDARRHGELLAPGITAVLDEAWVPRHEVTAVAVGVGPGPFTGLRVGLVTARTLGLALGIPVYGVCTLDVLAAQAVEWAVDGAVGGEPVTGPFLVTTDARRKEVYWATYDEAGHRLDGPHVDRPADVATDAPVVGAGARLYPDAFGHAVGPEHPDARVLAGIVCGERAELLDPEPLYLRRPDVAAPSRPKRVS
jgi:tRNA threonylcarbamoyladenosine biosynthesis protein TsaB